MDGHYDTCSFRATAHKFWASNLILANLQLSGCFSESWKREATDPPNLGPSVPGILIQNGCKHHSSVSTPGAATISTTNLQWFQVSDTAWNGKDTDEESS